MHRLLFLIFISFSIISCGGSGETAPSENVNNNEIVDTEAPNESQDLRVVLPLAVNKTDFDVKDLRASFYTYEETGEKSELIYEELVDQIRINYSWDYFQDIDASELNGVWSGSLDIKSGGGVYLLMDGLTYADFRLLVDGSEICSLGECGDKILLELEVGIHQFEIDFYNDYHTVNFNAKFFGYDPVYIDVDRDYKLESEPDETIYFVNVYEADSLNNEILVHLPLKSTSTYSIVLFSIKGVRWRFVGDDESLNKVYLISRSATSDVANFNKLVNIGRVASESDASYLNRKLFGLYHREYEEYDASEIYLYDRTQRITVANNLVGDLPEVTSVAESRVGGQEVATYFELEQSTMLKSLNWRAWSDAPVSYVNGTYYQSDQSFLLSVYDGSIIPDNLIFSEEHDVNVHQYYGTEGGHVYRVYADFESTEFLPAGKYWLSIRHSSENPNVYFGVVLERSEQTNGGAFRAGESYEWYSMDFLDGVPADTATGIDLYLSGAVSTE
jgi:hypothetical protein